MHRSERHSPNRFTHLVSAVRGALCVLLATTAGAVVAADGYPSRPIRYIVPAGAGNAADAVARMLAVELTKQMGQQVIVDNRPGASGTIATELIAHATPDGYTIGHGNILTLAITQSLLPKLPYDSDRDLQPVVHFSLSPIVLAVTLALPVKSVRELIAYAKQRPGALLYASPGNGSSSHVSGELFKIMTNTQMVHVPYKSSAQGMTDLVAGRVHLMFNNLPSTVPLLKSGKLRALGTTGPKRSPALPDLPTIAEAGVPGFEVTAWGGLIVPTGVPKAIVARLNAETNKAISKPEVIKRLVARSFDPVGGTPEQFATFIHKERTKWADVVKRAGVKVD